MSQNDISEAKRLIEKVTRECIESKRSKQLKNADHVAFDGISTCTIHAALAKKNEEHIKAIEKGCDLLEEVTSEMKILAPRIGKARYALLQDPDFTDSSLMAARVDLDDAITKWLKLLECMDDTDETLLQAERMAHV